MENKYLNREEIKSLDFVYIPDTSQGDGNFRWYDSFSKGNFIINYFGKIDDLNFQDINCKMIIYNKQQIIFEGKIKNILELRVLLKQLGIND